MMINQNTLKLLSVHWLLELEPRQNSKMTHNLTALSITKMSSMILTIIGGLLWDYYLTVMLLCSVSLNPVIILSIIMPLYHFECPYALLSF
jgi:hypothetical protein